MTAPVAQHRADIGTVKAALKAMLLGPEYAAALADVERTFSDGITLSPPAAVFTTNKTQLPAYPAVELLAEKSRPTRNSGAAEYGHVIEAWFWECGSDEETLTAQVERKVLAARRMLRLGSLMPYVANAPIECGDEDFSPVGQGRSTPQPFLKVGVLQLLVETMED